VFQFVLLCDFSYHLVVLVKAVDTLGAFYIHN